jgi:hypothetical protein
MATTSTSPPPTAAGKLPALDGPSGALLAAMENEAAVAVGSRADVIVVFGPGGGGVPTLDILAPITGTAAGARTAGRTEEKTPDELETGGRGSFPGGPPPIGLT